MMNQESLLAVLETLGDGIAARKNFEENQREHCEQLFEQNQLLMKELKGLKAEIAEKDELIEKLNRQIEVTMEVTESKVGETFLDEDCTIPCGEKAD